MSFETPRFRNLTPASQLHRIPDTWKREGKKEGKREREKTKRGRGMDRETVNSLSSMRA